MLANMFHFPSSGKSALLESLTNIPFPRNLELCTRYATQITSRREPESRLDITIIPGPHASDTHKKHLADYRPRILSTESFRAQFPGILKEANARIGIRTDISSHEGTVFSEDILKIEICGPEEDYLTIIDVPGIFRNPTEGITTKDDIQLVQNMVKGYIKHSRTIILAVLPSNVDTATQEILTLAEDYDKAGERTLGVLTKPDLVTEQSARANVCNLLLGKKRPLTLGYYIVRSRGADDDDAFDRADAERMFLNMPWSQLPKDRLGVLALKARLSELLSQITRKEFPELRKSASSYLTVRHNWTGSELVDSALTAHYSSHVLFEEVELRLITYVVNLTELFNYDFERKAHVRHFEMPRSNSSDESDENEEYGLSVNALANERAILLEGIDLDEYTVLENIISKDCDLDDTKSGIMEWTEMLYLRCRGVDLGTFSGAILSSAFKEQSSKWASMTKAYVSRVIVVIHRFMVIALDTLCTDMQVREEIWSSILDEVLKRYKAAMDQAMFLASIEREKRPYTVNHYFNENLQVARGNRKADMLKAKSREEIKRGYNNHAHVSDNLIVDLDDVRQTTRSKSNVEQVKEEIHDILWSYYKVARKRFVDNVYQQAVDNCLLTGPMSPLAVFTQEWVIELDAEQLETIAGESPITKERRTALMRKIHDLEVAMRILRD
ncbi:interferon-induced GTP-binding protein Mx2 [Periconia macrospinosa]|uniref:Interferon-induced GTP-binding protein Mx2 n=1 Tax=Periconia macrospinosa TaxID=97972 RepID=A0A2V1CYE1_9PLEO|nr:interferon-induced GTP-binding protein Mx2 [Periconia macrospinosa]